MPYRYVTFTIEFDEADEELVDSALSDPDCIVTVCDSISEQFHVNFTHMSDITSQ